MPAIMHFLSGEADVTLGSDEIAAAPGCWIHMPPHMPHSIHAKTPVVDASIAIETGGGQGLG